jgi:hypothetical protein
MRPATYDLRRYETGFLSRDSTLNIGGGRYVPEKREGIGTHLVFIS